MVQTGQITLYGHSYSPYVHRVRIALEQAKADYTFYSINMMAKPAWYAEKVNPAGKIPAITYGGPIVPADQPSSESAKINESMVIVEFIADVFPEAGLRPSDPVKLAYARLFVTLMDTQFFDAFKGFVFENAPNTVIFEALEALQSRLPETGFAVGEFSIADVAAAPFLARLVMLLDNDLGRFPVGEGKKTLEVLRTPKFARIMKYIEDVKQWPSFRATFDEEECLTIWKSNPYFKRN